MQTFQLGVNLKMLKYRVAFSIFNFTSNLSKLEDKNRKPKTQLIRDKERKIREKGSGNNKEMI